MRAVKLSLIVVAAIAAWALTALFLAFYGWWMQPVAEQNNTSAFFAWAVNEIATKNKGNSALVLIDDGVVEHQYFAQQQNDVNPDTLFATASFSKLVTALAVMALVEQGQLDLDAPVSQYLTRWQLPQSEFDNEAVTARLLLSHTAGLTDRLGFADYQAHEVVPPLEAELANPRASSGAAVAIAVGVQPGSEFIYSGGGYLILQLLVEELSGNSFDKFVHATLLQPLLMSRSTFAWLGDLDNVSASFNGDGSPAPTFRYASAAATSFASSAADLTRLAQALITANGRLPLAATTLAAMREPHGFVFGAPVWGLGTILYAPSANDGFVYGHDGGNEPAINSTLRINPDSADAFIMLVNGHPNLASSIGAQWVLWQTGYPDGLAADKVIASAVLPIITGSLVILVVGVIVGIVLVRTRS